MVVCEIANQWYLRQNEYDMLVQNGKITKCSWWAKNMSTNTFIDYSAQIGSRIRGDRPFNATLELDAGEYMFGTGDYQTMSPDGRHCSQVFYLLVDDNGGHVCKKSELPSNGGSGPAPKTAGVNGAGAGANTGTDGGYWANRASPESTVTVPSSGRPEIKSEDGVAKDFFLIGGYRACLQDMSINPSCNSCDDCDMCNPAGEICCDNCSHGTDIYIKKG